MKRMIDNKEFEKIKKDVDDCIKKSDISGLVKNDGTIDTNIYAKISDLDKGIYYTTTAPTLDSGTNYYKLSTSNLVNANDNFTIKSGDIVVYVNNGSVDSIYVWSGTASGSFLLLELVGSFGGGKQLYQHNIRWVEEGNQSRANNNMWFICDKSTALTFAELQQWLTDKGFKLNDASDKTHFYGCVSGMSYYGSYFAVNGIATYYDNSGIVKALNNSDSLVFINSLSGTEYTIIPL